MQYAWHSNGISKGVCVKLLTLNQCTNISGGGVFYTAEGYYVMDGAQTNILGTIFTSDGHLYDQATGALTHNFALNPAPVCIVNYLFSAKPIDGGYFYYSPSGCTNLAYTYNF